MIRRAQLLVLILLISVSCFYGGYYFGQRGFVIELKKNPPKINVTNREPSEQNLDFKGFWEVWDYLNKSHIDRPLDAKKLYYGAISGMVNAVGDDYTSFFAPTQNALVKSTLSGTYEGIGAELGFKDSQLIIISPLDGSPAIASGILPGDKILEIEGVSTVGINLQEAVIKIRGDAGTVVTLKLQRGDQEPKVVPITRGKIVAKSVSWRDLGDSVAYIRLSRFGDNTNTDWSDAVIQLKNQMPNLKGVVLDVRGNPGGYLNSAIFVASEFIPKGAVMFEEKADHSLSEGNVDRRGSLIDLPLVVLIDKGSASASEIVAAALRDDLNAKLVGVKSFGKGTIQTSQEFKDGSSIHVTIAKWLTPKKEWVHKVGLTPDIVVERSEEDVLAGRDPQLDKAKEEMLNQIKSKK